MPRKVIIDGKQALVPDDATDEEINALFPAPKPPSTNGATLSAPQDDANPVTKYLRDVGSDLSLGGSRTGIGRALGYLQGRSGQGFSGLQSGVSEGAANIMGSPEMGVAHALTGLSMVPQHPIEGAKQAVGGALEAATIPGMMVSGPGATGAIEAVPSRKAAGRALQDIAFRVGRQEIPIPQSQEALQRLAELSANGGAGKVPAGVQQLIQRNQGIFPMQYPEARDFVSNISGLSANERMGLNPQVGSKVGELAKNLHGDIANALNARQPGLGQNYLNAIQEYAQASRNRELAGSVAKKAAAAAVAGTAAKGAYDIYRGAR